ncbi:type IV pilin protein [Sandaracinus amylolyticus]|uniref:type IV pilin protein n=1 Tax=Sandaracinus amylolyticus TaxID=927083 RepID=UPI001F21D3A8|nr:prepilin-type N-terminal cleavage/methylation domain-containing protein [Sandaracinus amylolyticus]UJR80534.1 Type IV pilus biogenesis protein PilE [Sandaracinus amylolyticus]
MRARRAGYSLVELLVVCAIVGILAAVAVPAFRSQMMRSRTTEAVEVLGAIRQAEESYYGVFSRYCGPLGWNPATYAAADHTQPFNVAATGWDQLGVDPDGPVRFRYQVNAGAPGTRPGANGQPVSGAGAGGIPGFNGSDHWYVSHAQADLDGDGATVVLEGYSISSRIYVSQGVGGSYLASGWE